MNKNKGWLDREEFDALDRSLSKLGFGGYYDFLECLKEIGSRFGAFTVEGGEIDRQDIKTIPDMMDVLLAWGDLLSDWRSKHPDWDTEVFTIYKKS